ncbi:hypothetical protein EG68_06780 [Paragonimus skrjabini miyazakii]|uniref:SH3 domain-containing protein n=1 Tax=Paragonimus skrjabini miyazakii TaxID=59628 RepID=A0A8S9YX83_9TREM|nr:hypothetical protein EG68_06780 [Paragonimus skrjabini miyazakii]
MDLFSQPLNRLGYDKQFEHHKQATTLTRTLAQIFQEKSELQSDYACGLVRLSSRLREVLGATSDETVHAAWLRIANSLETEASVHKQCASTILEGLVQPWVKLVEELTKKRKPLKTRLDKVDTLFETFRANELRAKRKFYAAFHACERIWSRYARTLGFQLPWFWCDTPPTLAGDKSSISCRKSPSNFSANFRRVQDHSFHSDSSDVESGSTPRSPLGNVRLKRHHSERSATLPSRPLSLMIADDISSRQAKNTSVVEKAKSLCMTTLLDYHKCCLAAENARVEWHTTTLKCLSDLRVMERQRLNAMAKGLTVYQRLLADAIPVMQTSAADVAEAARSADSFVDIEEFRKRAHLSSIAGVLSQTDNHSHPPFFVNPYVGCSQQRLPDVPGEFLIPFKQDTVNMSIASCAINERNNVNFFRERSDRTSQKPKETFVCTFIGEHLTRHCLFRHLDLLRMDVTKERRTKRGLINLVQVYAHEPAYADVQTYIEARRRLFVSRVRLTYLTHCRQKTIYSLMCRLFQHAPQHVYAEALEKTGFQNLPWSNSSMTNRKFSHSSSCMRWIPLPDLNEEDTLSYLTRPMEWPPFPKEEAANEDLNDDLFDWELERLMQLDLEEKNKREIDQIDPSVNDLQDESSASESRIMFIDAQPDTFPVSSYRTSSSFPRPVGVGFEASSPSNGRDAPSLYPVTHKNSTTSRSIKPIDVTHHDRNGFGSNLFEVKLLRSTQPLDDLSVHRVPKTDANHCLLDSSQLSTCAQDSITTSRTEDSAELPHVNNSVAKNEMSSSSPPSATILSKTKAKNSRSVSVFWSRFRTTQTNRSRKLTSLDISLPTQECEQSSLLESSALPTSGVSHVRTDEPCSEVNYKDQIQNGSRWPSALSLHCIGWAKVERSYTARANGELTMCSGDIVSIFRKESDEWWLGELNGFKGRFPASHVEEF